MTPPESPSSLFTGVVQFAAAHGGLPVFIAEWGSVPYSNTSVRVNWIQQMQSFVAANPAYARGDELAMIARVDVPAVVGMFAKWLRRALAHRPGSRTVTDAGLSRPAV